MTAPAPRARRCRAEGPTRRSGKSGSGRRQGESDLSWAGRVDREEAGQERAPGGGRQPPRCVCLDRGRVEGSLVVLEEDPVAKPEGPDRVVRPSSGLRTTSPGTRRSDVERARHLGGKRLVHLAHQDLLGAGVRLQRIGAHDAVGDGPDQRPALTRRRRARHRGRCLVVPSATSGDCARQESRAEPAQPCERGHAAGPA